MSETCQIAVRVTPRSAKPRVGSWSEGADGRRTLELRVTAAPADGAANAAVVRLFAEALGVPRGSVAILSGRTSRHKRVEVRLPLDEVMRRLGPIA